MAATDLHDHHEVLPARVGGIFHVQVAAWPAMSPLPFSRAPESRARQPTASAEVATGTRPNDIRTA